MSSTTLQKATDIGRVDGPLQGYHREWYVVRPGPDFPGKGRLKVGEPREDVLWYDRRCFASEDLLLVELAKRDVPRIPPVHRLAPDGPLIHGFIEGTPLNLLHPRGHRVPLVHLGQIMAVFRKLAAIRPWGFPAPRLCKEKDRPEDGNSEGFLRTLLRFTHEKSFLPHADEFGGLFRQLGLTKDVLRRGTRLDSEAGRLTRRPFCLLHGDLHRANFIVGESLQLWTIDWELAMLGDPLYDLATHLHLMEYPADQEPAVVEAWRAAVSAELPEAVAGLETDLPRYRAYKRIQSVYTDVVRHVRMLQSLPPSERRTEQLGASAKAVHQALWRARHDLRLTEVPTPAEVEYAYGPFSAVLRGSPA
ncbi:phosphotransferase family protein [Streptomyces sp. NPDC048172]|uniref:phosphotransferase family protein n=1 Tax=Streptomyces sp. NPDC048172 TaxID=3365505 RepID=UPI00370F846C